MNVTGITGFGSLVKYTNDATGGILIGGGLIVFFIITLVILFKEDRPMEELLAVVGWSYTIVAAFFWAGGYIDLIYALGFAIISALSSLYMFTTRT